MTTDPREIEAALRRAAEEVIKEQIDIYVRAGDAAMEMAYSNEAYRNISGNLRSSIGYGVYLNGRQVAEGGFVPTQGTEGDGILGASRGRSFLNEVASTHNEGVALIIVAGMDYAVKKESEGTPVITDAALFAESFIRNALQ